MASDEPISRSTTSFLRPLVAPDWGTIPPFIGYGSLGSVGHSHHDLGLELPGVSSLNPLSVGNKLAQVLERERSDVASVALFSQKVDQASYCLYLAFDKAKVDDFEPAVEPMAPQSKRGAGLWYSILISATLRRYADLKRALLHPWTPSPDVELLTSSAFAILCEGTPAESQLRNLFDSDRPRAFQELTRHLDLYVGQLKAAIELAADLESPEEDARIKGQTDAVQAALLAKAGNSLSLTNAAALLGVSRQALHKRIGLGTALGLMYGSELVVPDVQFVKQGDKPKIVDNLAGVVRLFDHSGAGRWSALQFLIEKDPNLGVVPIDALKSGKPVLDAARAFLALEDD